MKQHSTLRFCVILWGAALVAASFQTRLAFSRDFDHEIAPLIAARCLSCHSGDKPEGKLDLSSKRTAMAGGESGKVIVPGDLDESLLWQHVESEEMPPKKPLPAAEKALLRKWIASGAKWGTDTIDPFRFSTRARAGYDWWSLQPLGQQEPPGVQLPGWDKNPIDAFVLKRLTAAGLAPSEEADKRALIRRLSFDLLGLPPTPAQVDRFLKDASDGAYEKIVDQMLASPHYGERWARHWLDVVRFGESNGFEYNQPRNNAWHYRNWVINALNDDMPYDEFVRMQLAGDVLRPKNPASFAATGFLVAGAHNTTRPSSKKMQMTMDQDELEDLVGVVGQTFLGLTVNCARCHDHKFDPISQREYYQFAATLAGVNHGERTVQIPVVHDQHRRVAEIDKLLPALRKDVHNIEESISAKVLAERKDNTDDRPEPPDAFATWEFDGDLRERSGKLDTKAIGGARVESGFLVLDGKSAYAATERISIVIEEKTLEVWVQLDNLTQRGGGAISLQTLDGKAFDGIVFGEKQPKQWMAGSDFYRRWRPLGGGDESKAVARPVHLAVVYSKDGTISAYRDGVPYGKPYRAGPLQRFTAGNAQLVFGMRHAPAGKGRMLAGRIQRARLYSRALTADEVAASAGVADSNYVSESEIQARLATADRRKRSQLKAQITRLEFERTKLTNTGPRKIYTSISRNPGVTKFLRRGNVADPGAEVAPSGLRAVLSSKADFGIATNVGDADRRKKLAEWVTHRDNSLFARVIVNRLWHYHFGQGLITTPNDFGYNGGRPSHPGLLDHLASALLQNDFRLKPVHRRMVTSRAYRQSSKGNIAAEKVDAENRLLWRRSPQRLEAEAIRDAMILVAGQLDPKVGGLGYRDVRHFKFKGSNFYEPLPENGAERRRRTIYRFSPRGGSNSFLDTFDCPDPSAAAPRRANTTTPLQALTLMNNGFVFQMADKLAQRVALEAKGEINEQVARVYQLAYGRAASDAELGRASHFVEQHGLPALCRVIFNSNEFIFVQ